jgi:hypothetical protein
MKHENLPAVNIERLKNRASMTNTEVACLLLGWQGGTIHQVAKATGLTVNQILQSKNIEAAIIIMAKSRKTHDII